MPARRIISPRDVLVTNFVIVCPHCNKESNRESVHAPDEGVFGRDLERFTCPACRVTTDLSVGTRDLLRWS